MKLGVNEAGWDRILRAVVGVILLYLAFAIIKGIVGILLGIVGVALLVTAATGFCLVYKLLNIRSNK